MVANLNQNPGQRPIVSLWLPALLKAGCMWLISHGVSSKTGTHDEPNGSPENENNDMMEERWLLPKELW